MEGGLLTDALDDEEDGLMVRAVCLDERVDGGLVVFWR